MKRLVVVLLTFSLFLCATNALAQAYGPSDGSSSILVSDPSTVNYRGSLELGLSFDGGAEVFTSHGVQMGDNFYVGAYFNCAISPYTSLSGGVDTRYYYPSTEVENLYVGLQVGGGAELDGDPILSIMPKCGIGLPLRKISFLFGMGYLFGHGLLFHFGIGF